MPPPGIDHVELRTCLGAGGFGEVYLGDVYRGDTVEAVAVKVLHRGLDARSQAVQRMRDEARMLHLLDHPSILQVHDLVVLDERIAMIAEYVAGQDLEDLLVAPHTIPLAAGLEVLSQVAAALQTAFTTIGPRGEPLRLLHRDIKPGNIRIGRNGVVKVLDFGIAKVSGVTREAQTQSSAVLGSFAYMAPERFRPRDEGDLAGDVYSLGCVLFEILSAGRMLYEGYDTRALFSLAMIPEERMAVVDRQLRSLQGHPEVVELVRSMVSENPLERPEMSGLFDRLDELAGVAAGPRLLPWCQGRSWPEPSTASGALSGERIRARSLNTFERPSSSPSQETLLEDFGPSLPAGPLPLPSTPPPAPAQSGGTAGLVIGLLVGVLLTVGLVGLGGGMAFVFLMPAGDTTTAPGPGVPDADPVPGEPRVPDRPAGVPAPEIPAPVRPVPDGPVGVVVPPGDPVGTPPELLPDPVPVVGAEPSLACDPTQLEARASAGTLPDDARGCLDGRARDTALRQTERQAAARVLLVAAQVDCRTGSCQAYEALQPWYFDELGRSDPDMMLAWAEHRLATARNRPSLLRDAQLWAERAREREDTWSPTTKVMKVSRTHEIRARAAYQLWTLSQAEDDRITARNRAAEWAEYLKRVNRDATTAMDLCASAAGDRSACDKRVQTEAVTETVYLLSRPIGAMLRVDGTVRGTTPFAVELAHGSHLIGMELDGIVGETTITVGGGEPARWSWSAAEGTWQSSL